LPAKATRGLDFARNLASGATVSLVGTVTGNYANSGGSGGQGVGGGVYSLGTFTFDVTTVIDGNHASTSNNDIFA
jgi:hypothetical protein